MWCQVSLNPHCIHTAKRPGWISQPSQDTWREKTVFTKGWFDFVGGWGELSQLILHPRFKHRWLSWEFVVLHMTNKNQIALHLTKVGRKLMCFGCRWSTKVFWFSVLWCVTAQSDISNGVGCVQLNWYLHHKARLKVWFLLLCFLSSKSSWNKLSVWWSSKAALIFMLWK